MRSQFLFLALILCQLISIGDGHAQFGFGAPSKATVTAVADVESIQPGVPFFAGVKLEIAPGWHTYWKNTGSDAGIATTIKWDLPEGFIAGELLYPTPHYEVTQGTSSHVFSGTVYHVAKITPPADLKPGGEITLSGTVDLLVCDEQTCEPPKARSISLKLPVTAEPAASSGDAPGITEMLDDSPLRLPRWDAKASLEGDSVVVAATLPEGVSVNTSDLYFFPSQGGLVANGKDAQKFLQKENVLTITIPKSGEAFGGDLSGILVSESGFGGGLAKSVVIATSAGAGEIREPASSDVATDPKPKKPTGLSIDDLTESDKEEIRAANQEIASWFEQKRRPLMLMLLFAFVGGIILNLMPCVFPVLGVKIMGFVNQAGEDKAKIRSHGLVFAAGVLASLWALVSVLLLLKHLFEEQVAWGFQLQDPTFLAIMILVLFAFGLNLSGLFEIGTSLTAVGSGLQQKHGYSGSFFSGVLAVLVATPCTGPFMGPAIGFALTGSAVETFVVFTALGVGLALPYVLLSFFPYLIQKLPKPGPWMETFKQFMAFPLYATVIWLVGVFGKVTGLGAISYLLFGLVTLALALWIFGRFGTPFKPKKTKTSARLATLALACCAGWLAYNAVQMKPDVKEFGVGEDKHGVAWHGYDPRKIVEARNNGRTIFIDFTADW